MDVILMISIKYGKWIFYAYIITDHQYFHCWSTVTSTENRWLCIILPVTLLIYGRVNVIFYFSIRKYCLNLLTTIKSLLIYIEWFIIINKWVKVIIKSKSIDDMGIYLKLIVPLNRFYFHKFYVIIRYRKNYS